MTAEDNELNETAGGLDLEEGRDTITPLGTIHWIPVEDLIPYDKNPRNISEKSVEQVAKSIEEFGWQQPIVADGDKVIIIGHTRRRAAIKLKCKLVPVVIETRLTEDQVKALRIADNRTHDYSTWDYPVLLQELEALPDDFSSILDLADWQSIVEGFENEQEAIMDLEPEELAIMTDRYALTVMFETKESAEQAAAEILLLPGVVNVRYTGK